MTVTGTLDVGTEGRVAEAIDGAIERGDEVVVVLLTREDTSVSQVISPARRMPEGDTLRQLATTVSRTLRQHEAMNDLIDQLSPALGVPSAPALLQVRRNAEARTRLLEEYGYLSAAEIADRVGSRASNRSALAGRWKGEGLVFSVIHKGSSLFPLFQFGEDGRPLPIVRRVLRIFREDPMTDWQVALWFIARNGWLDDRRPVDLLTSDGDAVVRAASHEIAPIAG